MKSSLFSPAMSRAKNCRASRSTSSESTGKDERSGTTFSQRGLCHHVGFTQQRQPSTVLRSSRTLPGHGRCSKDDSAFW